MRQLRAERRALVARERVWFAPVRDLIPELGQLDNEWQQTWGIAQNDFSGRDTQHLQIRRGVTDALHTWAAQLTPRARRPAHLEAEAIALTQEFVALVQAHASVYMNVLIDWREVPLSYTARQLDLVHQRIDKLRDGLAKAIKQARAQGADCPEYAATPLERPPGAAAADRAARRP